jgi:DNA-binding NtrC family response regulator
MYSGLLPNLPILIVNSSSAESDQLKTVLGQNGLQPHITSSCQKALNLIQQQSFSMVLSNRVLPDGDWKIILQALESISEPPELVVFSRQAEESLWYEVLQSGGFDVLSVPFNDVELIRVTALAQNFWQRKHRRLILGQRAMRAAS